MNTPIRESQVDKIDCAYLALREALAGNDPVTLRQADAYALTVSRESTPDEVHAWAARVNKRENPSGHAAR